VRVLLDQVIDTDYGQLDLVWDEEAGFDGDWDRSFAAQVNGLAGAGEDGGALDLPPGAYRVRVGARGRDAGAEDELADDVVDFYVIQLWPSPRRPDEILRTTSANAAYWHGDVGSRR
jgi:hypothetical protein